MGCSSAIAGLLYEPSNYAAQDNLVCNLDGIRNAGLLEAWDGSAWGAPTYVSVPSYTYTEGVSPAKVRLTWQWAGDGTTIIVR